MNFYSSMEVEMTDEYFPLLHYNKKRYGFYFLNSEEYVFQHEGKNAICISEEFDIVVKNPQERKALNQQNLIQWLQPLGERRLYSPLEIQNDTHEVNVYSVPVEDKDE